MATPRVKAGGYIYRQRLTDAQRANSTARRYVKLLLDPDDRPGPTLAAYYLAQIASALSDIQEAHAELDRIIPQEDGSTGG